LAIASIRKAARRYQLNSIVERLAWAAIHTIPQPYRIVTADA
jgi:hypothetical protein